METLLTKNEFYSLNTEDALCIARKQFLQKLFRNELEESLEDVLKRMKNLIQFITDQPNPLVCIAHSFFLKILTIYLSKPEALNNELKLIELFQPQKRPYSPLEEIHITM